MDTNAIYKIINDICAIHPMRPFIVMPQWWIEKESAARPNDFLFYEDGTITWCGYIVYRYGDIYERNQC